MLRSKSCCPELIWAKAIKNGEEMTKLPLNWKRARAQIEKYEENSLFTSIRKKTLYTGNLSFVGVGAITVAENTLGLLDVAREDPTAAIRSQYRIRRGYGGKDLYIHMTCDIAFAISHRQSDIEGGTANGFKQ